MADKKKETVKLVPLEITSVKVKVVGDTSLLMNKFSDRAKESIVNKQTRTTKSRGARDIDSEVEGAVHKMSKGRVGFPASGFKNAMVEVAPYFKQAGLDKKRVKGAVHITAEENGLIPISFKKQKVNEANVKINRGMSGEVRYRPEFEDWSANLTIRFNKSIISIDQIVNLLNYAGFHIGIGDWNPQHNGTYGTFHIEA